MTDRFFEQPVLNSPYEQPGRHWGLDNAGQPTQQIIEGRRPAAFISPIPKPEAAPGLGKAGRGFIDYLDAANRGAKKPPYNTPAKHNTPPVKRYPKLKKIRLAIIWPTTANRQPIC